MTATANSPDSLVHWHGWTVPRAADLVITLSCHTTLRADSDRRKADLAEDAAAARRGCCGYAIGWAGETIIP
jgi:hypothetical protein